MAKQDLSGIRTRYPFLLAQRFVADYDEIMKKYEIDDRLYITRHILSILELQKQFVLTENEDFFKQYAKAEMELLERYGKSLSSYSRKQFKTFFYPNTVLVEKEIITPEHFNSLPPEEQRLSVNDMESFIRMVSNTMQLELEFLLLNTDGTRKIALTDKADSTLNGTGSDEPDKNSTKARQLLVIYYLLKNAGIEHRQSNSVSAAARLAHLLTGTKFTTIHNSDLYKKYLLMPNYKSGEGLIKDLQFIRSYFEDTELTEAVKEIDKEIARTIKELPAAARKKWQ